MYQKQEDSLSILSMLKQKNKMSQGIQEWTK